VRAWAFRRIGSGRRATLDQLSPENPVGIVARWMSAIRANKCHRKREPTVLDRQEARSSGHARRLSKPPASQPPFRTFSLSDLLFPIFSFRAFLFSLLSFLFSRPQGIPNAASR
jgi:hypothetical protein